MRRLSVHIVVAAITLSSSVPLDARGKNAGEHRGSIENRWWHIARYRGNKSQGADEASLIGVNVAAQIIFRDCHPEGSAGCGGLVGDYKISDDNLAIHPAYVLIGLCLEGRVQNDLIISALRNTVDIEQKDDRKILRDRDGHAQILLIPCRRQIKEPSFPTFP
jgi:hypothetical protein